MDETRNKGSEITTHDLKLMTGEFDLESIHHLDLSQRGIQDLSVIGKCTGLVHLNASHNRIRYLRPLGDLKLLENLDLSCNTISSLDGLEGLDSLVHLNIAGNMLRSADELKCLSKLDKLRKLRLKDLNVHNYSNPVCQTTSQYKTVISDVLPQLTTLDGERIRGKGSDFYYTCDELDSELKDYTESCGEPPAYKSAPWPGPFIEADKPLNRCVEEAELGFNDVMSLCKKMNSEALRSVMDADSARWNK